jgi:hypothetical protein
MHDFDRDLQFELDIWQSIIEIEQRRIHLRFTRSPLKDEGDIDFPTTGWRRLWVVGNKWWASLSRSKRQQYLDGEYNVLAFQRMKKLRPTIRSDNDESQLAANRGAEQR